MKYRQVELQARKTYTSDTTEIIDINLADPISNLIIAVENTNSSATMTAHPLASVLQIDLVDGSDVLFSLDGYEAEALDWYNNGGQFRSNYNYFLNGGTSMRLIGINFGRKLWDELYAFDPKMFTNPQLKIQLDIDAGGMSCATMYLTVWANVFDEKVPSLQGFLTAKEVKQYTMASATHEYTDLPLDHTYRSLFFRPFLLGTEPNQAVTLIKLSEDQDKRVPFEIEGQEITRNLMEMYGPVEEHYYFATGTSTKYIYCAPTTRVVATGAVWAAAAADAQPAFYNGDGGRLDTITDTAGSNYQVFARGWVPHCVYQIPFGDQMDPDDWYDVRGLGSLRLDITGAAAAQGFIFLQQLRPY